MRSSRSCISPIASAGDARSVRIALIDDSPTSQALFDRIASALGHHVVTLGATESTDLLARVTESDPEIIVLDGRFGDLLGTDGDRARRVAGLVASLREHVANAPIAIIATLAETTLVRAAAGAGAAFVIARPLLRANVAATMTAMEGERIRASR